MFPTPFAQSLSDEVRFLCYLAWSALVEAGTQQIEQVSSQQALDTLNAWAAQYSWSTGDVDGYAQMIVVSVPTLAPTFHTVWTPYVVERQQELYADGISRRVDDLNFALAYREQFASQQDDRHSYYHYWVGRVEAALQWFASRGLVVAAHPVTGLYEVQR